MRSCPVSIVISETEMFKIEDFLDELEEVSFYCYVVLYKYFVIKIFNVINPALNVWSFFLEVKLS